LDLLHHLKQGLMQITLTISKLVFSLPPEQFADENGRIQFQKRGHIFLRCQKVSIRHLPTDLSIELNLENKFQIQRNIP
jgi:hypothetical protein